MGTTFLRKLGALTIAIVSTASLMVGADDRKPSPSAGTDTQDNRGAAPPSDVSPTADPGPTANNSSATPPAADPQKDPQPHAPQPPASRLPVEVPGPLSIKIGSSYLTPFGFIDVTYVGRSTNVGSGIGTNFAFIPFANTPQGRLTDGFLSLQNSRIGARFDTIVHGANVLAYWESDFLGNQPTNILDSTNSDVFRLRLFWVQVKKNSWEVVAGQTWSLITPGRKGISPLPADIFYTLDIDTNYQVGIPWARIPAVRFVWHPTKELAWAIAGENSQQYIGGSAGGGLVTLPANLTTILTNQLNNGTNSFSVPTVNPDIISKVAYDPTLRGHSLHIEAAGMMRTFRIFNSLNDRHFSTIGGAGSFNSNLELIKGGRLRLLENFYAGRGVGRWLFGEGPDLIVNSDGALGLLPGGATLEGLESQFTKSLFLYGYYGVYYFGRGVAIDTNGKPIGYGYTRSPNGQNRTIQEGTVGFQYVLWKDPKWGSLQFYAQASYVFRSPWFVAPGTPSQAKSNMGFLDLRYVFPGEPPK